MCMEKWGKSVLKILGMINLHGLPILLGRRPTLLIGKHYFLEAAQLCIAFQTHLSSHTWTHQQHFKSTVRMACQIQLEGHV